MNKQSSADEKEHMRGVIRRQGKTIKSLKKEVSRLSKYLKNANFEYEYIDEDELFIKAPVVEENKWECSKCGVVDDFSTFEIFQGTQEVKYTKCNKCRYREKEIIK